MSVRLRYKNAFDKASYPRKRWDMIISNKYWFYNSKFRLNVFTDEGWPLRGCFDYDENLSIESCMNIVCDILKDDDLSTYEQKYLTNIFGVDTLASSGKRLYNKSDISVEKVKITLDDILNMMQQLSQQSPEENRELWYETARENEKAMAEWALKHMRADWGVKNLDVWLLEDAWTIEETAALSLKLDPRYAYNLPQNWDLDIIEPVVSILEKRLDRVRRAVAIDILNGEYIVPAKAKEWFEKQGFWETSQLPGSKNASVDLHANTKHKLYSIIIAMAIDQYEARIGKNPTEILIDRTHISRLCEACGLPLDQKTMKKYFVEMAEWAAEKNPNFTEAKLKKKRGSTSWPKKRDKLD